jgi:hypothetical protein
VEPRRSRPDDDRAGVKVYEGMIIGEHTRDNDLEVNVLKGKKLTNIRASGKDEAVRLTPPDPHDAGKALAYIQDDELVEVTPKSSALRKVYLDPNERKRDGDRDALAWLSRWMPDAAGQPSRARTGIHAAHQLGRARPAGRVEQHDPDAAGAAAGV